MVSTGLHDQSETMKHFERALDHLYTIIASWLRLWVVTVGSVQSGHWSD